VADGTLNSTDLKAIEIATIDAMVCVFESERPGDYGAIAASATDRGGLSYGKHQAALVPGTLAKLVGSYCSVQNAGYAAALKPFLQQMEARDRQLDSNGTLHGLLKAASTDPVMHEVQDKFFASEYMGPALAKWKEFGFKLPLSAGLIYDSYIQSGPKGFAGLAAKVEAQQGKPSAEMEKAWCEAYVAERRKFLEGSASKDVRNSVVRMATFEALINSDNWHLTLPLRVLRPGGVSYPLTPWDLGEHLFEADQLLRRGGAACFGTAKQGDASGPNGRDRFVQSNLIALGVLTGVADGRFGAGTTKAVRAFQKKYDLNETGVIAGSDFDHMCDQVEIEQTRARGSDGLIKITPAKRSTDQATLGGAGAAVAGAGGVIAATAGSSDSPAPAPESSVTPVAETVTPAVSTPGAATSPAVASPVATATAASPVTPAKPASPTSAATQAPTRTYDIPLVGHVPSATIAIILAVAMVGAVLLVSLGLRKSY
jgi:peptidoglycan hydrolase-like protein with peptidoglycan-binding domain